MALVATSISERPLKLGKHYVLRWKTRKRRDRKRPRRLYKRWRRRKRSKLYISTKPDESITKCVRWLKRLSNLKIISGIVVIGLCELFWRIKD